MNLDSKMDKISVVETATLEIQRLQAENQMLRNQLLKLGHQTDVSPISRDLSFSMDSLNDNELPPLFQDDFLSSTPLPVFAPPPPVVVSECKKLKINDQFIFSHISFYVYIIIIILP